MWVWLHICISVCFNIYYCCKCTQGFRSSPSTVNINAAAALVRKVEAKYPALLFKQQLTAYVEKIYGIIRDNLKKELGSLLSLCIQVTPNDSLHFIPLFSGLFDKLCSFLLSVENGKLQCGCLFLDHLSTGYICIVGCILYFLT